MNNKEEKELELTKEFLETELETKSFSDIARDLGTYPNKVRRAAKRLGVKGKSRSDLQKMLLAQGKLVHPTKGKKRDPELVKQISKKNSENAKNRTDEEKKLISEKCKERWENVPLSTRKEWGQKAAQAVRKTAEEGSKLEKLLVDGLTKRGFVVEFHRENLVPNQKLQIDLFIPELTTAIEIDGPAHFFPIWGEESLQQHIKADGEKAGLLLGSGFCIIRVRHLQKFVSKVYAEEIIGKVAETLEKIRKKYPGPGDRYIELE